MITLQPSGLVGNPHFNFGVAENLQKTFKNPSPIISEKCSVFERKKTTKLPEAETKVGQHKTGGCSRLGSDIILVKKYPRDSSHYPPYTFF